MFLKQGTARVVRVGPFLDSTDGNTAETGLTIGQADIRLSKNGGDFASTNQSGGATHDEGGFYALTLDATDSDTVGELELYVHVAGALYVKSRFFVLAGQVYDSMVGADRLQVDAAEVSGSAAAADALEVNIGNLDAGVSSRLASAAAPANFVDLAITAATGRVTVGTNLDKTGYDLAGVKKTLDELNDASASQVADAVLDEPTAQHQTVGSLGAEVSLAKAMLANKRVHTISTGVDVVMGDDGVTPVRTMTPTDGGNDVIEVVPS